MVFDVDSFFSQNALLKRIHRSLIGRKRTYRAKAWAFLKRWRMKSMTVGSPEFLILILGCQRSGTTLIERIFRTDLDSVVFGEYCELTIASDRTVWQPLDKVQSTIASCNAKYAVAKPLFESNRAVELLAYFTTASVIWMFRDPTYVVHSMKKKWDDQFFEISRKVESDEEGHWRCESLIDEIEAEAHSNPTLDERYALFWKKRNEIAFVKGLDKDERVLFLNYETLVKYPEYCIEIIMRKASGCGVWRFFHTDANIDSLRKSLSLNISDQTQKDCQTLYERLNALSARDFPFE